MLVYFMTIWSIVRPFGVLYGHLIYFMVIRYVGQKKSDNPDFDQIFFGLNRTKKASLHTYIIFYKLHLAVSEIYTQN
jgi:hypothetical protein